MLSLLRLEIKRYKSTCIPLLSCLGVCICTLMLLKMMLPHEALAVMWIIMPALILAGDAFMAQYHCKGFTELLLNTQLMAPKVIRCQLWLVSIGYHMPLALTVFVFVWPEYIEFLLCYWLGLDIIGFVFYSLRCLMIQSSGLLIGHLLLIPFSVPFVILGMLGSSGELAAIQVLLGIWIVMQSLGPKLLLLFKRIGHTG